MHDGRHAAAGMPKWCAAQPPSPPALPSPTAQSPPSTSTSPHKPLAPLRDQLGRCVRVHARCHSGNDHVWRAQVWSTESTIGVTSFTYLFAAELASPYTITPSLVSRAWSSVYSDCALIVCPHSLGSTTRCPMLCLRPTPPTRCGDVSNTFALVSKSQLCLQVASFSASAPIELQACGMYDFTVHTIAPVLGNGWALLGEPDKWVSVSAKRFSSLSFDSDSVGECTCVS